MVCIRLALLAAFGLALASSAALACTPPAHAADLGRPLILVAKPELRDTFFGATVLVVAPLGGDQHAGFIVNRPTQLTLGKAFRDHAASQKGVAPIYFGGPVQPSMLFALVQRASSPGAGTFEVMPGLYAAFDTDAVDRIIESEPEHARFVAGLVAWRRGELRDEIELGAWYVLEPDANVVTQPPERLWEDLVRRCERAKKAI